MLARAEINYVQQYSFVRGGKPYQKWEVIELRFPVPLLDEANDRYELKMRGYNVDVGNLTIIEKDKNDKAVKKQLEVDFICSKGSRKYYIQSAYMLGTEEKMAQEIRPFLKINDSFKKIVITSNIPRPFYTEDGILMMSVYDFLLNPDSLEL